MICNNCGSQNIEGLNFCTHCGAEIRPSMLKVCIKCSFNNKLSAESCKKCGNFLKVENVDYRLVRIAPVAQQSTTASPQESAKPQASHGRPSQPPAAAQQAKSIFPQGPVPPLQKVQTQAPSQPPVQTPGAPIQQTAQPQRPLQGPPAQLSQKEPQRAAPIHPPVQPPLKQDDILNQASKPSQQVVKPVSEQVPPAPKTPASGSRSQVERPLFCNICGAKNEPDQTSCIYCQSPLKKPVFSSTPVEITEPQDDIEFPVPADISASDLPQKAPIDLKAQAQPQKDADSKVCPECGTENPAVMIICFSCGYIFDKKDDKFTPYVKESDAKAERPAPIPAEQQEVSSLQTSADTTTPPPIKPVPTAGDSQKVPDVKTQPFAVCPKCFYRNSPEANSCMKCGFQFKMIPTVKKTEQQPSGIPSIDDNLITCPICGKENPGTVLSCNNCNYHFLKKKQEAMTVEPPQIPEKQQVFCKRCNTANSIDSQNCRVCGEKLYKGESIRHPLTDDGQIDSQLEPPVPVHLPPLPIESSPEGPFKPDKAIPPQPQDSVPPAPKPGTPVSTPVFHQDSVPGTPVPSTNKPVDAAAAPSNIAPPPLFSNVNVPHAQKLPEQSFIPEWEKKSHKTRDKDISQPKTDTVSAFKETKGIDKKKLISIGVVIIILIIASVLLFLGSGDSKKKTPEKTTTDILKTDDLSTSDGTPGKIGTSGLDIVDINSDDNKDISSTEETGSDNLVSQLAPEDQLSEYANKGMESLQRNRILSPRNNNALFYYKEADKIGLESSEFAKFKSLLILKLSALGDSKIYKRDFNSSIRYYQYVLELDPTNQSAARKIDQVKRMQREDQIERNQIQVAIQAESIEELQKFIQKNPTSYYVKTARDEIERLKRKQLDIQKADEERKKREAEQKAWLNKKYTYNVVNKYFLGQNRGTLTITRTNVIFQPVDDRSKRFSVTYDQIKSFTFENGEIIITFNQDIGEVGNDISFVHISEQQAKTKQILDAYNELRPK